MDVTQQYEYHLLVAVLVEMYRQAIFGRLYRKYLPWYKRTDQFHLFVLITFPHFPVFRPGIHPRQNMRR